MKINSDYKELLSILNAEGVKYLVIGGYAEMVYTQPRYTKYIDIWIERIPENAAATFRALSRFGAPLAGIKPEDLTDPASIYQVGVEPVRADILTSVSGLEFTPCWDRRNLVDFEGIRVGVLSRDDLALAAAAAGRKRDRDRLKRLKRKQ
jgi:predicted nucleotidyltransferase